MNQRAQYLIQILDKIGTPLLGAAEHGGDDAETAQIVASLLGKAVETSIAMNQALDLNVEDVQDDSLRLALAALAGSIVSEQYKQKGKVPEAADLSRIQSAMSAVLTFGDNFTLSPDHIARLDKLKADGAPVDAHQINIQYVNALIPVINAIGAFPFGQPEQKLIMDVSDRLVKRTAEIRETLLPGLSGDDEKLAELAILGATANIYASCHQAETQRLTGSESEAPESLSIDPVWDAFETRTAMLEAVVKNIMPEGAITQPLSAPPTAPAPSEPPATESATPPEASPVNPPVSESPPPSTPEAPAAASTESASEGAGPMGFFVAPKDGDQPPPEDNSVVPPLAQPKTPPPSPEPPASAPAAPETSPPDSPDTSPTPPPEEGDSGEGDQSGGNPMSFFGKKE